MNNEISIPFSYNEIISYTIDQALSLSKHLNKANAISGFCPLQGPTGGGKSSALYRSPNKDIPASLEYIKSKGLQAILVTHRWNILHDIYNSAISGKDSQGNPFRVSIIYAQDETITAAVLQQCLPHENEFASSDLPNPFQSIQELEKLGYFSAETATVLERSCKEIIKMNQRIKYYKNNFDTFLFKEEERKLKKQCSQIENILLTHMTTLEKNIRSNKRKYGKEHSLTKQAEKKLQIFRLNKWIRRIFPAITWRDDNQHLLLLTTQKLFTSFYDGKNKVNISSDKLAGKVIFIDEFDYQADILQSSLSQSQIVQEPPECIGQLLESGKRLLARMRYTTAEPIPELYEKLKQFITELEGDLTAKDINLNQSRALVIPLKQYESGKKFDDKYLFRSDHLVTSERITLHQLDYGFEVINKNNDKTHIENEIDVGDFLRVLEKYIRKFNFLLSNLSQNESDAYEYLRKLNRLLFDSVNDYRSSHYSKILQNSSSFSFPHTKLPELKAINQSNLLPNTQINISGLTTWLLTTNIAEADIDPLRIKTKRALLPTTPEGLMASLASRNLVFALSATSYIERAIGNFDIRWIENALRYIAQARNPSCTESFLGNIFEDRPKSWFSKPIPYLQTTEDKNRQISVIKHLGKLKSEKRNSKLTTQIHNFDKEIFDSNFYEIKQHLDASFFEVESYDHIYEYRQSTLLKLLYILGLSTQEPYHKGHLVFVNSFKYLKKWLLNETAENSRKSANWIKFDPKLQGIFTDFPEVFIPLTINDTPMILCMLNAESQKQKGFELAYQAAFETNRTVFVITQTASATNGINLDYSIPSSNNAMDLTSLFIVESKHFFFSSWDRNDDDNEMAHAGFQLRNLEKLVRASAFSRKQQRAYIMPLMNNSSKGIAELNARYKTTNDYIKNIAADIQQQVGRIERVWNHIPNITIHLSNEIAQHLRKYSQLTTFTNNRHWISNLNNQLIDDLINTHSEGGVDFLQFIKTPSQNGSMAIEIIDNNLIPEIRDAREGKANISDISSLWYKLGRAVLQHDLQWEPDSNSFNINTPLYNWACFEIPEESKQTGEIWYDPKSWQFFAHRAAGLKKYNPQQLYKVVQHHPEIYEWFNRKGFRISLIPFTNDLEEQYAFHPAVVQRILQGRIGEESIKALLNAEQLKVIDSNSLDKEPELFELYDFEIANTNVFVDAKYWSHTTIDDAENNFQQWISSGKDPSLAPLGVIKKLEKIQATRGKDSILVIANLLTDEDDCSLSGFSEKLVPQKVENASILFLSGCLTHDKYQKTSGFNWLSKILHQRLKEIL
ncbi:hypothetical protein [Otariodibacter sp.]|uniref:hypothetical protein n=1 Tax=Otariodibacter sp. TaxID=3030919 RepID=UPI00260DBA88|nr:hypothetical protein [Otariodibacter sp.]